MDLIIRENNDGKYLAVYANYLREGIDFAARHKVDQLQLRGYLGADAGPVNFEYLKILSQSLRILSFAGFGEVKNITHLESIYTLKKLEKLYIQEKQSFEFDVSLFPNLWHLGFEYWARLKNFNKLKYLRSLIISKYPKEDLSEIATLTNLETLHIYNSKITTLRGIEDLTKLSEIVLARNNNLEDISLLKILHSLRNISIEKCKKITDVSSLAEIPELQLNVI